jgi:plasmid maintenance system antidote protein VapI
MGLNHVQFAEELGVVYQTVERWEHDRTPITAANCLKIVHFLGFDPKFSISHPGT